MTDSAWKYNYDSTDAGSQYTPDSATQILLDKLHAEKGQPPTVQPRSNYGKFPDTNRDWWPTDHPVPNTPGAPFSKEDTRGGWGVHWVDAPKVVLPWPPQSGPTTPPGKIPEGPVYNPDKIQPSRLDDDAARQSVKTNADARSIYLTAGLAGAGVGTGVHMADVYTGAIDPAQRTGAAAWWRNNLSPSQAAVPGRAATLAAAEAELPALRGGAVLAQRTFNGQVASRLQLTDNLIAQIPSGPITPSELKWYNARVGVVSDDTLFRPASIMANAGSDAEVKLRQKLFTQAEANEISCQASGYWRDSKLNDQARQALASQETVRDSAATALNSAERGSITTGTEAFLKGAGQGLVVATAAVVADNVLDRALGNSPLLSNQAHWGLQGIGVPLLLLSKASPTAKVLGSVAMVGVSHTLDQYLGPPTGVFSAFARPSLPEIGLATAGALVPVKDMRVRAGLAVTGWLAGKAWNYLDDRYEITGKSEPRLRDAAAAATDQDLNSPTVTRFDFAADQMHKFSDKNDAAAAVLLRDWQNANMDKTSVERERGSAALMLGFGESLLDRGSRIDQSKWDKKGERLLAGLDYDLGGQATSYLRAASSNLSEALKLSRENKGGRLSNGTIDDGYIYQLDSEKNRADQTLDRVYGRHDISAVYTGVRNHVSADYLEMKSFADNLSQYANTLSDRDPRFKAKISRDLAIIQAAFAAFEKAPAEKSEHLSSARAYAEQAGRLDPNAQDLADVKELVKSPR
jgi:hypothetical protein